MLLEIMLEYGRRRSPHNQQVWIGFARRYAISALIFIALLGFFQWVIPAFGIPAYILPTPSQVLARMLINDERLWFHFGITALESLGGFAVGSLLGFALATLFVHTRPLEDALYPWVVISQTVPLVAIAPLLVIWFGNGMLARVVMSALFAFFPVLVNTMRGLRHISRETFDLLRAYNASTWQIFWLLRVPNSLPYLFTGMKIGSTLAIIGAIVGEFAGAGQGLGFVITISTYHLETARTFAAVVAASLLGMGLYLLLVGLERRLVFWQPET